MRYSFYTSFGTSKPLRSLKIYGGSEHKSAGSGLSFVCSEAADQVGRFTYLFKLKDYWDMLSEPLDYYTYLAIELKDEKGVGYGN